MVNDTASRAGTRAVVMSPRDLSLQYSLECLTGRIRQDADGRSVILTSHGSDSLDFQCGPWGMIASLQRVGASPLNVALASSWEGSDSELKRSSGVVRGLEGSIATSSSVWNNCWESVEML